MSRRRGGLGLLLAFIRDEAAGGVALVLAALVAIAWANSPAADSYAALLDLPVTVQLGQLRRAAPLHFIVNDGLMAIFFLLVGLEIRREVTVGRLASLRRAAAPLAAALGGMVLPALIFVAYNRHDPAALRGWAIPVATDIAFSLAVLQLLGSRIPAGLKVFLTALAIIDDLGAILIIAFFYTAHLDLAALGGAALAWVALLALNRGGVGAIWPYMIGFAVVWGCLARSGVHATLSGVAVAMVVPMQGEHSVGRRLERALNDLVAFAVLPLFGLFNAGLPLAGITPKVLLDPVVPGIAAGLFVGKQLGVFGTTWLATKLGLVRLPDGLDWGMVYGAAILCGIGFTMSLFIGNLAFAAGERVVELKLAVFVGSLLSAGVGAAVLAWLLPRRPTPP